MKQIFSRIKNFVIKKKTISLVILAGLIIVGILIKQFLFTTNTITYTTAQAEKGTFVLSITASGQVSATNNATVSTQASGVVKEVFVQNDQQVASGDKIAELDLDLEGKLRSTQSWSSYQSAQNSLDTAKANMFSTQSTMLTQWKSFMDTAQSGSYQNSDGTPRNDTRQLPQYMSVNDDWLAAEAKYKIQQNVVNQAQTALSAAWLSYQQSSPIIYAPISGTVTGLSLQPETVLTAQSNSSGNATSQKIASIKTNAAAQLSVNLSEVNVTKIKIGNKATITLDALPDKTYTGKVISIDTIGAISSGVTNYPAIIGLDSEVPEILPNMSVTATIITNVLNDVIMVPTSSIQTINGQSIIKIMKNGKVSETPVETGESNSTQTVIISGINATDEVITNAVNSSTAKTTQGTSVFGSFGGNRAVGPR
ncbi:MAG: Efflux transporter, RND family, MFP subunit [Candidatus Gottesmanbacteria bacterium GW2011_GWA1_34_13]|uniref:Efflux transporter, RND family, MFP subunit n=1 Tax=Candidatus Gottesmanbacteria bacterium GW2011_GWA1_34_13 TaxID=1618434 RepID=A0A0G0B3R7_9BACT|nr:MAG: Efflux transporter, RND family, MFP subunit [Candidatus Gottesmanbacteria bacterium GW2011_GWA1_34_13]